MLLKRGMRKNEDVRELQEKIFKDNDLEWDGVFGGKTERRIKELQRKYGMKQTGVADDVFMERLNNEDNEEISAQSENEETTNYTTPEYTELKYTYQESPDEKGARLNREYHDVAREAAALRNKEDQSDVRNKANTDSANLDKRIHIPLTMDNTSAKAAYDRAEEYMNRPTPQKAFGGNPWQEGTPNAAEWDRKHGRDAGSEYAASDERVPYYKNNPYAEEEEDETNRYAFQSNSRKIIDPNTGDEVSPDEFVARQKRKWGH